MEGALRGLATNLSVRELVHAIEFSIPGREIMPLNAKRQAEFEEAFVIFDPKKTGSLTLEQCGILMRSLGQ